MPKVRLSYGVLARLKGNVRQSRRCTIYKMLANKNNGKVPCFVCGEHVDKDKATLEHIIPISKGGTDSMDNLAISHFRCNVKRGNCDNDNR